MHSTKYWQLLYDTSSSVWWKWKVLIEITKAKWRMFSLVNWGITDPYYGLSPVKHQDIIETSTGWLLIEDPGTNLGEIWIKLH